VNVIARFRRTFLAALVAVLSGACGCASAQPASRWSDEVLYFVLIDRYADGDRSNDDGVDLRNPGAYHGGDLAGLASRLDELADLGITAIWINPVQKQMPRGILAQAPARLHIPEFTHWGFHGYWIYDFNEIEPHFGTREDLRRFVAAAHRRGIKVLLDVVYNHPGYDSRYRGRTTSAGEPWLRLGEGNCEVAPLTCAVGGLPDFRTELPEVRSHLLDANIGLAKYAGVDGFRLDTYKHVESDFWHEHRARTRAELAPNFFLLAEYWGGTASSLDEFFARDEVDAGFDFSFKGSCEDFVSNRGRTIAFASYLGKRHRIRPGYLVSHYLSSHDVPMSLANLGGDKEKFRLCVAVQMTSLGLPMIYYGEEVGRGGSEWPVNRTDMPWGQRDILPGKGAARDESLRDYYKALIRLRKSHPALTRGNYVALTGPQDPWLAYLRTDPTGKDKVLVVINRGDKPLPVSLLIPDAMRIDTMVDALGDEVIAARGGRLELVMPPRSARVLLPTERTMN
jgi:alpha-amylase